MKCPKCHKISHKSRSLKSGRKLYKCTQCDRWFNEFSGSPLRKAKLPTEKIVTLYGYTRSGMNARIIATLLEIHISTVYRWIKKFSTAPQEFLR
jgi:transposase-like protein